MSLAFGRSLSWCSVCGLAIGNTATGPHGIGVRVDEDNVVHEHCFKCSSCHRRLSLETYRQDKLDKRFYCAKHHNGYAVLGASQSLPRAGRHSVGIGTRSSIVFHSESPAERRRVSTPVRSPSAVTPASSSSPLSQRSVLSSSNTLSTSSGSSLWSAKSAGVQQRSPGLSPAYRSSTIRRSQSNEITLQDHHHHGKEANSNSTSSSSSSSSSVSTSAHIKATKAAAMLSEGNSDMPKIETKMTSGDDERHRSGSMPRKTGVTDISRSTSNISTRSDSAAVLSRWQHQQPRGSLGNINTKPPTYLHLASHQSSNSSLGDEAVDDSSLDSAFLHELSRYKRICKSVAKSLENTSGDATPTPSASAPPETIAASGSVTPRQFKRLPIPELWSSASESSRFIQPVYGYYTEAIGSPKATTKRKANESSPRERAPSPMLDRRSSRTALVSPEDVRDRYSLDAVPEDLYEEHFHGKQHWNFYVQNEPGVGACILSLKQEVCSEREQFRVLVRSQFAIMHGLLPTACLLANRYNRKDVVAALKKEMGFEGRFHETTSPNAADEILALDKAFNSRQLKVGLVYVAPGQRGEEEIFNNTTGSRNYDDFMGEIGDRITLKDFDGFRGGLDAKHEQTGEHSLYRKWNEHEIMFHVSTMLPHGKNDRQQLQKKRHIGNDMVCIVFVDDMDTPFSPTTIRSHFLHTFLVVHCDSTSFPKRYRVDVVARDSVPQFGPPLAAQNVFPAGSQLFSEFLLSKLVNSYRASSRAAKFHKLKVRTLTQLVKEVTTRFALHELESTESRRKLQRRGSWLPSGVLRPPSPLRDSMQERFLDSEQLAHDLQDLRTACKDLCDVNFIVGERREAVCAIKAVLAVRSGPFREFFRSLPDAATPGSAAQDDGTPTTDSEQFKFHKQRSSGAMSSGRIKLKMSKKEKGRDLSAPTSSPVSSSPVVRRKSKKKTKAEQEATVQAQTQDEETTGSPNHISTPHEDPNAIQENEVFVSKAPPLSMLISQLAKGIDVFQVTDFSVEAFSAALDFIHSGSCTVTPSNVVGLACAAALMDIPVLEKACNTGLAGLLRPDTIMDVLKGAEPYYQRHQAAKTFISSVVAAFCEANSSVVLEDAAFPSLCDTTVTLLYQMKLTCPEALKFDAALKWSFAEVKRRCLDATQYAQLLRPLVGQIDLKQISTKDLMHKVLPTGAVPEDKVLLALAYQADPGAMHSLEGKPLPDSKTLLQLALEREALAAAAAENNISPTSQAAAADQRGASPRITDL